MDTVAPPPGPHAVPPAGPPPTAASPAGPPPPAAWVPAPPVVVAPPEPAAPTEPAAPIARSERSLAPDIARGAMLLFIAVANVGIHRWGYPLDADGAETGLSVVDRITLFVEQWWVADRSRPMFAILYGFGIAMIASRLAARGRDAKAVRKVLRRRSWWLVALGLAHSVLLFMGDILLPYGATGLVALLLVNRSDRALKRWFWVTLVVWEAIFFAVALTPLGELFGSGLAEGADTEPGLTYAEQLQLGAVGSAAVFVASLLLFFAPPVIIGFWLHRRGWLLHPEQHVAALRRVVVVAVVVNVVANLPHALQAADVISVGGALDPALWTLHSVSGLLMGAGYICGFALLAVRWRERGRTGVPRALASVGERSLTAYLLQSVIMAPVLQMWGLGLGEHLGTAGAYAYAIGTWLVILGLMVLLDRAGRRGPAEVVLRRLTYGRT